MRKYESCLTHGSSSRAHGARGRPPATASSRELPPHHRTCGVRVRVMFRVRVRVGVGGQG